MSHSLIVLTFERLWELTAQRLGDFAVPSDVAAASAAGGRQQTSADREASQMQ
jgi:hypothetical protein